MENVGWMAPKSIFVCHSLKEFREELMRCDGKIHISMGVYNQMKWEDWSLVDIYGVEVYIQDWGRFLKVER